MAIRMREWASAPGIRLDKVVIPTKGVEMIGKTGEGMANDLQGVANGVQGLIGLVEQVKVTGELSELHEKLVEAHEQTRAELEGRSDVKDYVGDWNQASERRISEAMQNLSSSARERAAGMVEDFRYKGQVEAARLEQLGEVDRARSQWETGVRQAAVRGDSVAVERHLEGGKDVFLPGKVFEQVKAQALDTACIARWTRLWDEEPVRAMEAMREGGEQPSGEVMRRALQHVNEKRSRAFRNEFASVLAEMDMQGAEMAPQSLETARNLGLMDDEQVRLYGEGHASATRNSADEATLSYWKQRIDTMAEGDDALADIRIGIAGSGLPGETRREFYRRVEVTTQLPQRDRKMLDARLERYCREGYLGAPGDAATWVRKNNLQDEVMDVHARKGAGAALDYLESAMEQSSGWVCFRRNNNQMAMVQEQSENAADASAEEGDMSVSGERRSSRVPFAAEDLEKERYWTSVLTGDPATIPDEVRRQAAGASGEGDDEDRIMLAVNRSWAADHLDVPREEVRAQWGDIRSQLAQQFGTREDEHELFAALSLEQHDLKPVREAVREADRRAYEKGFDGEGLPAVPQLEALPDYYRRVISEVVRSAHLEGAAERERLMPIAEIVWDGMKTIMPQEVPLDEEEKHPGPIESLWRIMSRSALDEPGSGGMDPVRMVRYTPELLSAVERLSSMSSEEREKVYRILQVRARTEKKEGMMKSAWRNFRRGMQDVGWGLLQAGGNALAAGGEFIGGDTGTLFGWDIRKSSQSLDLRMRMLEEMRRALENDIVPLRLDEHANAVERTVVDASRSVAPAMLALCGGVGFGVMVTSGMGSSMAGMRQKSPDGNTASQASAALTGGVFEAVANVCLSKVGAQMLKKSMAAFAGRQALSTPSKAYIEAAKAGAKGVAREAGMLLGYNKVSEVVHMGLEEMAAADAGVDSGIDWAAWGKSQLNMETHRREAAAVLPFLLIGSGRVALHHFKSVPAVLGDGSRLKSWGVPDEAIRQILSERDKVRQGEMLRQAIVRSPKWGGVDFIHQATVVLNLLNPVPGYVFKTDGAVREFLNLPADYQPPKRSSSELALVGKKKAYEKYGLMGDPAACKKAFEIWDGWWTRAGLTRLMTDPKGARHIDSCAISMMWRESRNLAELAARTPRDVLPARVAGEGVYQPNMIEDARVLLYDRMRETRERPYRLLMSRETVDGLQLSKKSAEYWKQETRNVDERMRTIVYEGVIRLWRGEEKNRVLRDVARSVWRVWATPASGPEWRASLWLDREGGSSVGNAAGKGKEAAKLPVEERLTELSERLRAEGPDSINALAPELRQACRLVWGAQADARMLMALMPMQRDFDVAMSRGFSPEDACAYLLQRELDIRPATLAKWAEYLAPTKVRSLKPIQDKRNALIRVEAAYKRFASLRGIEPSRVTGEDGIEYWQTLYPNGMPTRWHASREDMLADWGAHVAGLFAPAGQSREALLRKWQNGTEIIDQTFEAYKGLREKEKMSVFEDLGIKASHDLLKKWYGGIMHRLTGESVGKPMNYTKMKEDVREVLRPLARVTVRNGGLMGRQHDPLTLDNPIALLQGKSDSVWHRLLNTRVLSTDEAVEMLQKAGMKIDAERLAQPKNRRDLVLELTELTKRYFVDHLDDPAVPPDLAAWVRYAAADLPATLAELRQGRVELEKTLPYGSTGMASRRNVAKWSIRGAVAEVQRLIESAGSIQQAERSGSIPPHLLGMLRDAAGLHRGVHAERAWMKECFPGRSDVFSTMERLVHLLPSNRFTEQIPPMVSQRLRDTLAYVTSFFGLLKSSDEIARGPWSQRSLVRLEQLAEVLHQYPDLHEWSIDRRVPGRFRRIVSETYGSDSRRQYEPGYPEHYRSDSPEPFKDYEIAGNCMLPDAWAKDPRIEPAIRTLDALRRYSSRVPASSDEGVVWGSKLLNLTGEYRPRGVGEDWSISTPLTASRRLLDSLDDTFAAFGVKVMKMGRGRPMRGALDLMPIYSDPQLPGHVVRLMPGFPDSANVFARTPYVVHSYKGVYFDVNGRPLSLGKMYRSYIPLEKFRLRPLDLEALGDIEAMQQRNLLWHLGWAAKRSSVPGKIEASNGIVPNALELMIRLEEELGQGTRWEHGQIEQLTPRDLYLLRAARLVLKQPDMIFLHHEDNANGLKNFLIALSRSYIHLRRELGLPNPGSPVAAEPGREAQPGAGNPHSDEQHP